MKIYDSVNHCLTFKLHEAPVSDSLMDYFAFSPKGLPLKFAFSSISFFLLWVLRFRQILVHQQSHCHSLKLCFIQEATLAFTFYGKIFKHVISSKDMSG
jgi:hypothetical protein